MIILIFILFVIFLSHRYEFEITEYILFSFFAGFVGLLICCVINGTMLYLDYKAVEEAEIYSVKINEDKDYMIETSNGVKFCKENYVEFKMDNEKNNEYNKYVVYEPYSTNKIFTLFFLDLRNQIRDNKIIIYVNSEIEFSQGNFEIVKVRE